MNNSIHMLEAIELAKKGEFSVQPNPMVGCIIAKGNKVIGRGWHKKYGSHHAEVNACLLYTSPSPRDVEESRMPSSA